MTSLSVEDRAVLRLIDRALQADYPLAALDLYQSQPIEVQARIAALLRRRFDRAFVRRSPERRSCP